LIAEPHYGGMTMDRDLLFLRLSIVWIGWRLRLCECSMTGSRFSMHGSPSRSQNIPPRSHPPPGRAGAEGEGEMTRLQKFVEIGEGSCRHVYVLRPSSLPSADEGKEWYPVEKFNAADDQSSLQDGTSSAVMSLLEKG
jgi:hypothetical protein